MSLRTIPLLICALALLWSTSAQAQAQRNCGEESTLELQLLESAHDASVVWGFTDEAMNSSVVWGNDSVDGNSLVWGTSVVWGVDGSDSFDAIWVDPVAWGIEDGNSACSGTVNDQYD